MTFSHCFSVNDRKVYEKPRMYFQVFRRSEKYFIGNNLEKTNKY